MKINPISVLILSIILLASSAMAETPNLKVVQAEEIETSGVMNYADRVVEGDLNLSGRTLGSIHFNNTTFLGVVNFQGTNFTGDAWFSDANFSGNASFREAQFRSDANFQEAEFRGNRAADFRAAEFSSNANFREAKFSSNANFRKADFCGGNTDFGMSQFKGDADFVGVNFY